MVDVGILFGGCIVLVIAVVLAVLAAGVFFYNSFIVKRNRVKTAWAQIDVQLKKRADLVPNLVEAVKGYAKHEKGVLENVAKARAAMLSAKTAKETAQADNMMTAALKSLFAVAEAYPELKASENFKHLQVELSDVEGKIAYSRQFYNDSVYDYNNSIMQFPGNIFAGIFKFEKEEFFRAEGEEKEPVKVKFE
ncbi:MAG: LemA family protein [Candidatus Micrarchaeota archaeon]|nr:LemA family protein [Candidatus Micrarchaeota archaeon]